MPRLIHLNGPPGCGKSTLAQWYVDEHPLALNLDIDRVRSLIGGWRNHLHEAGLLARAAAIQVAGIHLGAGHDVVIPQYVGRVEFIEKLEQLASEVGAVFVEIVLLDSKENSIERFVQRTVAAVDRAHVAAFEALDQHDPRRQLAQMYDQLLAVVEARPNAKTVATEAGNTAAAYELILSHLK